MLGELLKRVWTEPWSIEEDAVVSDFSWCGVCWAASRGYLT